MNQDFTVQKKAIFVWKKIRAEGFTWKKIPAQAVSEKKNSCKLKIPHPQTVSKKLLWQQTIADWIQTICLYVKSDGKEKKRKA